MNKEIVYLQYEMDWLLGCLFNRLIETQKTINFFLSQFLLFFHSINKYLFFFETIKKIYIFLFVCFFRLFLDLHLYVFLIYIKKQILWEKIYKVNLINYYQKLKNKKQKTNQFSKMTFSATDLPTLEKHLAAHTYLSGTDKPAKIDAQIATELKDKKVALNAATHPNVYAWFSFIGLFTPEAQNTWADVAPVAVPVAAKKEAKKETKTDDVDLFGDDDEEDAEAEALREKKRLEAVAAKEARDGKKKKAIAKTILVFNVKVFEAEQDLDALAKKIYETIQLDGLVWNKEHKKIPVAFGVFMLQMGCIIEDDKVNTDSIFEPIQSWEDEVQSVDVETMQKL
ncbi:EF-1 guanine nucleotide exchange domain protein (macronuclear) [Tetrahymena thermophila SB210]|uniref:EF-1 guanine nucleotide exchange domain protein n=1 Tax=Tetrahymena thermophila (strain SB210) TaxID=312017 RepID=Q23YT4_TETTS|nr:EF-1 guanine nucleotide exchange domain protein [Tetrahymena thermophila SB210]EAS01721.2 EF-1 guanine nucleotide exchange domain protein [Tetrahymena thermophila SB210]|eukprot:XP_001021966.2 EF-1 guanine nucleotide exchange domain protein [Tetrahymena thermophila SB210]